MNFLSHKKFINEVSLFIYYFTSSMPKTLKTFAGLHERLSREAFPGSMPAGGHGAGKVFHGGRKSLKSSAWSQLHQIFNAASSMPAGESLRHGASLT
jgi:hypothetical protein